MTTIKYMLYTFICSAMLILCGCSSDHTENETLNEKILKDAKALQLDTVELSGIDLSRSQQFYVYQDSILIVNNYSRDGNSLIELYELKSKVLLNRLLKIGRGRNEVLQCNTFVSDNKIIIYDFQLQKLFKVDIDSAIANKNYIPPHVFIPDGGISRVAYLGNHTIVENLYVFDNDKLKIHQNGKRLLFSKDVEIENRKNYKFNTQNVAGSGLIISSPNKQNVMYASGNYSFIEMYNNKLELEKKICGPKQLKQDYYIDENNEVIFNRTIPYAYINYYCTEKEVGLLYYGALVDVSDDEFENHNAYLLVFDWEGNLKKNYAIGAHALTISNSVKYPNTYYCCIRGKDKELYLCKAHE